VPLAANEVRDMYGSAEDGASEGATPVTTDAAVGRGSPNAQYLGNRLGYEKTPEASFDPVGSPRVLGVFVSKAFLYLLVYLVAAALFAVILGLWAASGHPAGALGTWLTGGFVAAIALFALFMLLKVPVLLSEWKFFVDDKGAAAGPTIEHIAWSLQRRQTPLDGMSVRRVRRSGVSRDYLEVRRSLFTGLISCFPYGEDLFVGWTFWLEISPIRYLLLGIQAMARGTGKGGGLASALRYDYAAAMREAIHSAAREGVDVAAGQLAPQGQGSVAAMPIVVADVDF
jgi:hypothetical protein